MNRILIPGLYDTSDESDSDEPVKETPPEDTVDGAAPEPCGADEVVEQEQEEEEVHDELQLQQEQQQSYVEEEDALADCAAPAAPAADDQIEVGRAGEGDDEEEEEEYDPHDAPFLLRKKQAALQQLQQQQLEEREYSPQLDADAAGEALEGEEQLLAGKDDEEEEEEEEEHFFVVDVYARAVRILPVGYNEQEFITLERIAPENLPMLNERVYSPNTEDDDHFYCEECVKSFRVCCPTHPLYRILDRVVNDLPEDRARKTKPAFIEIRVSSIPNAGQGAFTTTDLPVGLVFGPYQGVLSDKEDTKGYSWEIRNVGAPSTFLDGSNPKYSNWMRYINSPRFEPEQNLVAYQYNGSVYYRVIKPVDGDQELLVWYGAKFGETLGVFSTKKSTSKRVQSVGESRSNPFIM